MILSLLLAAHAAEPPAAVFTRVLLVEHCDARPVAVGGVTETRGPIDLTLLQAAATQHPRMSVVSSPSVVTVRGEKGSMSIGWKDLGGVPETPEWSIELAVDTPAELDEDPSLSWTWERRWRSEADPVVTAKRAISTRVLVPMDRVANLTMRADGDPTCPGGHTLFATAHDIGGEDGIETFQQKLATEQEQAAMRFSSSRRAARRREAREVLASVGLDAR